MAHDLSSHQDLEDLRMRTNFVAFTFANPQTEFQWEASRLFDSLLRLLPLALVQGCQQASLQELSRAVEASRLVLRHPSARRWGERPAVAANAPTVGSNASEGNGEGVEAQGAGEAGCKDKVSIATPSPPARSEMP